MPRCQARRACNRELAQIARAHAASDLRAPNDGATKLAAMAPQAPRPDPPCSLSRALCTGTWGQWKRLVPCARGKAPARRLQRPKGSHERFLFGCLDGMLAVVRPHPRDGTVGGVAVDDRQTGERRARAAVRAYSRFQRDRPPSPAASTADSRSRRASRSDGTPKSGHGTFACSHGGAHFSSRYNPKSGARSRL